VRPIKIQLIDFQLRRKSGIALDSLLAYQGRLERIKKLKHTKNNFMKSSIFSLALALVLSTTYAFAAPADHISDGINASFRNQFHNAKVISAEGYKDFTKLTFEMNEQVLCAYYAVDGSLMAVTRNIPSSQLPVSLLLNLKKQLNSGWITELFEFNSDTQHCYYVSLENADIKVSLRSNGDSWEIYSTLKK
jgi:hypothetical protein